MEKAAAFLASPSGFQIAYQAQSGAAPIVMFCPGFMSDMRGSKAAHLAGWCASRGQAFVRFDYTGHGQSMGGAADFTIGRGHQDTLAVLDQTTAPVILIGSSMGGWQALLAARARPDRVRALVLVAPAPDFTEWGLFGKLSAADQAKVLSEGRIDIPSGYGADPYVITRALIEDGRQHLLMQGPISFSGPVRLLHGQADPDVPWPHSLAIAERVTSQDVRVHLIKDGDHRLSRPADLDLLTTCLAELHA
jgi:pimeloyl-ACP methyl ester carboxylesterase